MIEAFPVVVNTTPSFALIDGMQGIGSFQCVKRVYASIIVVGLLLFPLRNLFFSVVCNPQYLVLSALCMESAVSSISHVEAYCCPVSPLMSPILSQSAISLKVPGDSPGLPPTSSQTSRCTLNCSLYCCVVM
jgi:hypothetical protein